MNRLGAFFKQLIPLLVLTQALLLGGVTVAAPMLALASDSEVESRETEDVKEKERKAERDREPGKKVAVRRPSKRDSDSARLKRFDHRVHVSSPDDAWSVPRRL